jgi:hypothetical protein
VSRSIVLAAALRIANVVALSGPGVAPDPTTVTFTVTVRKD